MSETHQQAFHVPLEHASFPDHFPGHPVVPGALLLQWVFDGFQSRWPELRINKVKSIKFLTPLLPGDRCEFLYCLDRSKSALKIRCEKNEAVIISGDLKIIDEAAW